MAMQGMGTAPARDQSKAADIPSKVAVGGIEGPGQISGKQGSSQGAGSLGGSIQGFTGTGTLKSKV